MDERIRLRHDAEVFSGNTNGTGSTSNSVSVVRALDFWFRFMVFDFNLVLSCS